MIIEAPRGKPRGMHPKGYKLITLNVQKSGKPLSCTEMLRRNTVADNSRFRQHIFINVRTSSRDLLTFAKSQKRTCPLADPSLKWTWALGYLVDTWKLRLACVCSSFQNSGCLSSICLTLFIMYRYISVRQRKIKQINGADFLYLYNRQILYLAAYTESAYSILNRFCLKQYC